MSLNFQNAKCFCRRGGYGGCYLLSRRGIAIRHFRSGCILETSSTTITQTIYAESADAEMSTKSRSGRLKNILRTLRSKVAIFHFVVKYLIVLCSGNGTRIINIPASRRAERIILLTINAIFFSLWYNKRKILFYMKKKSI